MEDAVPLPIMPSSGMVEERRTDRIACLRQVRLETSDGWTFAATCTDINRTGIGMECDHVLKVGQRVEMILSDNHRVPMMIIYRMGHHYGLSALSSFEKVLELLPLN